MTYLGIAWVVDGTLVMPDALREAVGQRGYEVVEVRNAVLLFAAPLDPERLRRIEELAEAPIEDHRGALQGLAQ